MEEKVTKSFGHGFRAVDETPDPERFFQVLDMQAVQPGIIALRAISIDRCEPRPGARILEVGCGTGEVARDLAARVAPGGLVIAVDASEQMIAEARRRTAGQDSLPVEFRTGDALALDFADGSFDAVRSERMLQHVKEPRRAFGEFVRVARPGGKVVVVDTDWETSVVAHPDPELSARLRAATVGRFANPTVGRELYGMAADAGLIERTADPGVLLSTEWDPDPAKGVGPPWALFMAGAVDDGDATAEDAERWLAGLREAAAAGHYFHSVTMFCVAGRTPQA